MRIRKVTVPVDMAKWKPVHYRAAGMKPPRKRRKKPTVKGTEP